MSRPVCRSGRFKDVNFWLVLSLVALMIASVGLGCGDNGDETTGTTVSTATETKPASPVSPSDGGGTMTVVVPTTATETVETDDGMPTVVYTHDEVGPCIDGMQEVTHYTEYSDGTSASSISMQPCGDDISPVEE